MNSVSLTPNKVKAYCAEMERKFGARIVNKNRSLEKYLIEYALKRIGVPNWTRFLEQYAITIGSRIYLPFEPGLPTAEWPLYAQVVTIAHELEHVDQYNKEGARYFAKYLFLSGSRAMYEADAYRTNMELEYWRTGRMLNPHTLANHLRSYICKPSDIRAAAKMLELSAITVKQDAVINPSSQATIKWLEEHGK